MTKIPSAANANWEMVTYSTMPSLQIVPVAGVTLYEVSTFATIRRDEYKGDALAMSSRRC